MQRDARRSAPGRAVALMLATVLLAGIVVIAPSAGADAPETFIVGAATRSTTPTPSEFSAGVYLGGYDSGRKATSGDETFARALVIGSGDQRVALVTLDLVGMGNIWMRAIRDGVAAATGISARAVMVHVSHSHGAPDFQGIWGGVTPAYRQRVVTQAVEAVRAAAAAQEPAELRVASAQVADFHNNRRPGGTIRDDALSVMQFARPGAGSGSGVIATLVNYAAHPTTMARSDRRLSTDFAGPAIDALEAEYPGSVGLFVNGTLGDLSPRDPQATSQSPTDRRRIGEGLADRAIAALGNPETSQVIPANMATVGGSVTFTPSGTLLAAAISLPSSPLSGYYDLTAIGSPPRVTAELLVVRLGSPEINTTIVTFPGEPLSSTGIALRSQLGGGAQFLFATTNESLGYLVPEAEWTLGGYEESVSLERLAGRKTTDAIDATLGALSNLPLADFTDVAAGASFARGVDWLAANGLTQGYGSARSFAPKVVMNRVQMALFLWRLMGEPAPDTAPCGFTDMVGRPQDQIDATCWLKEQGVTTGVNEAGTLYGPSQSVTRAQMGGFMFRLAGGVQESGSCGFTDPPSKAEFARAACWLKANGITTGTNTAGTQFSPLGPVTRGQMAAFLYRLVLAADSWTNPLPPSVLTN